MKLSVVIPCYNGAATIGAQLAALAEQRWSEPWEVLVVDNRSTDNSFAIVEDYRRRLPNLRIIPAYERQGQPYALNVGARAAAGESLAFVDADDVVGAGWLAAMGKALARHEFIAARVDVTRLNDPWVRCSHSHPQEKGLNRYRHPPYLPHAGGGTLGVRRALHEAIGGFDEELPLLHDTDYCWRLQLASVELHFVADALIHLRYRDTLCGLFRQARSYAEYNVALYKKYRPLGMPPISVASGLAPWLDLVRRLPQLRTQERRAAWLWRFAWCLGRLQGSIRHRVFAL
jgi:GT2 family glycosyltransferase